VHQIVFVALVVTANPLAGQAVEHWVLETSTLTYHVSHPLHQTEGVSHVARGKGECRAGACEFLIAAPVQSFGSGDSNRDLHMLQVARGGAFPMVSVRTHLPEAAAALDTIYADLDVEFAGQQAHYARVPFARTLDGSEVRISGIVPMTLSDFKIDPPALFGIPVKNDVPVRVETTWRRVD
jgi:hypothetical protein